MARASSLSSKKARSVILAESASVPGMEKQATATPFFAGCDGEKTSTSQTVTGRWEYTQLWRRTADNVAWLTDSLRRRLLMVIRGDIMTFRCFLYFATSAAVR